jgi:hypothetical protein
MPSDSLAIRPLEPNGIGTGTRGIKKLGHKAMSYKTTDAAYASWLERVKQKPIIVHPKVNGRATFEVLDVNDEDAARLQVEYQQTESYVAELARRSLISRIPTVLSTLFSTHPHITSAPLFYAFLSCF